MNKRSVYQRKMDPFILNRAEDTKKKKNQYLSLFFSAVFGKMLKMCSAVPQGRSQGPLWVFVFFFLER